MKLGNLYPPATTMPVRPPGIPRPLPVGQPMPPRPEHAQPFAHVFQPHQDMTAIRDARTATQMANRADDIQPNHNRTIQMASPESIAAAQHVAQLIGGIQNKYFPHYGNGVFTNGNAEGMQAYIARMAGANPNDAGWQQINTPQQISQLNGQLNNDMNTSNPSSAINIARATQYGDQHKAGGGLGSVIAGLGGLATGLGFGGAFGTFGWPSLLNSAIPNNTIGSLIGHR